MKVELEIISDRMPTKADSSKTGMVFVIVGDLWSIWPWIDVQPEMRWSKIPPPPPKPQIDTSLVETCDSLEEWVKQFCSPCVFGCKPSCTCVTCKIMRVIEAARKWDEHERESDEFYRVQTTNDHDGVGEGWRLLSVGEVIERGDEVRAWNCNSYTPTSCIGWKVIEGWRNYRRRITSEET